MRLNSPPSCAECHEIWEPKPPGTLWATPGLLRDSYPRFTFARSWFLYRMYMNRFYKVSGVVRGSRGDNLEYGRMWLERSASYTRVGTLIVATIYLQLIQNRYMFRS